MTGTLPEHPIFLLGMPRSGTTWLSQIFESSSDFLVRLSPNYSYLLKNQITITSSRTEWLDHLEAAANSEDPFMTQSWRRDTGELSRFHSSPDNSKCLVIKDTRFHDLYQRAMEILDDAKIVYVVRHPGGAINSWWRSKEFPPDADLDKEWRTGTCRKQDPGEFWGFDDWCSITTRYLELEASDPERYLVFRYEDLVQQRERVATNLFSFAGCELSPETSKFLRDSGDHHDDRPYSVFKSPTVAERWRSELPSEIQEAIETELLDTPLARFAS